MKSKSELNETNIKKVCRTCLTINTEEMTSIFDEIEQEENGENAKTYIYDMLFDVAQIAVDAEENIPTLICVNCLRLSQISFNFKKQCNRSQAILFEYLTEKKDKITGVLSTEKSPNQNDILNKSAITEFIDTEVSVNEIKHESITIKNEDHELSNLSSSDDLLNAIIKLEFDDELIKSGIESETEKEGKVILTLCVKQTPIQGCNVLNKKPTLTEFIDIEQQSLSGNASESRITDNDIDESSNPSSSDDFSNANDKLDILDEIIESDADSEFKETLPSKRKYNKKTENVFTCKLCNISFKTNKYLIHMKNHQPEDKYVCKICNKRFKYPSIVTVHMNIHKDERSSKFRCKICGITMASKSHLTEHIKKHTKPYECNICGKTLSRKYYLTRHLRTHTGKKPFKCTECDKAFSSSTGLKEHSFIHTGLKPFSCDVCKRSFNRSGNLRQHKIIHTNERSHVCQLCGKGFILAHHLRTHLQSHK